MNIEIHGLSEFIFLDIILIWLFVTIIILFAICFVYTIYIDDSKLIINDNNIIDKILKLKKDDRHLYKFTKKLSKDNINFLQKYKTFKLERVILNSHFNQKLKPTFINNNEKRLYKKIESIIYYYDLINK